MLAAFIAVALAAAAFGAAIVGPVAAQSTSSFSLAATSIAPGGSTTATGNCVEEPGLTGPLSAELDVRHLATATQYALIPATVDANGDFSVLVGVPANAPLGAYDVRLSCQYQGNVPVSVGGFSVDLAVVAAAGAPTIAVDPLSGPRPLAVTISGSACADAAGSGSGHSIEIVATNANGGSASTTLSSDGTAWTTSLSLSFPVPAVVGAEGAWIGRWTIRTRCIAPGGAAAFVYPDAFADATGLAPELSVAPTTITVGESVAVTANRCPDPELPVLGGDHFVEFTIEYLLPPDAPAASYTETVIGIGGQNGVHTASFTVPTTAPTLGNAYRVTARCRLSELGGIIDLFTYSPAALTVNAQQTTPTPTPTPTVTPGPTPTPTSTPTPGPTATPAPTSTAVPTPTPTPGQAPPPSFTG